VERSLEDVDRSNCGHGLGDHGRLSKEWSHKRTGGPCRAPIEAGDPQAQRKRDVCLPRRGEEETPALAIGATHSVLITRGMSPTLR
jgi:hypothetical protein